MSLTSELSAWKNGERAASNLGRKKWEIVAVILMLVSQRAEVELIRIFGGEAAKRSLETQLARQRGAAPSLLEGIVVLYVLGFIWQEMREVLVTSRSYNNGREQVQDLYMSVQSSFKSSYSNYYR